MTRRQLDSTKDKKRPTLKLNKQTVRDLVPPKSTAVKGGAAAASNKTEPTVAGAAICSKAQGACTVG